MHAHRFFTLDTKSKINFIFNLNFKYIYRKTIKHNQFKLEFGIECLKYNKLPTYLDL